ncbi:hypothetical protein UA08_05010 [Talaromyces atroroseus]|uniref:FAD/NAD(P)-binding domain-containing protein n=1 Tax=Talaromyces atroroseus TaxID=1441469 RepID=A0A225AE92_TALAT|nr:hypothetical protein UA08_05010 [Talaromyces atroroseus]OKL59561.1 hypothetical protein UA08_05010 [Talaromyces atroroseus]
MDDKSEITVVGAGWEFTLHATAFIAAGARITAYEMAHDKFGAGQIGLNMKDEILDFHQACRLAHLMPDFTLEHLERLPSEVKDIMNLPCHQTLSKKRRSIKSMGKRAYEDLPDAEKMSKKEVVETKRSILEYMVAVGVLKVIPQEVTVDMVASWLEKNKPVFLLTGSQLNLEKSGLNHLIGNPRFLKEFLMVSEETKKFTEAISDLQQAHAASGCQGAVPRVGIVGGGSIALSCELDLGKILQPNLEIISISPEKRLRLPDSLLPIQEHMTHRFIPGYVSDMVLSEDENAIESVKIISFPGREIQTINTSLFVHIFNVYHPPGKWEIPSHHAMESITKFLDERDPENALIRDYAIGPHRNYYDIVFRIDRPWFLSLKDDEVLVERIKSLIEKDPDQATIVANGSGPMVNRLIWLADFLGYRGQFCQVALPLQDGRVAQLSEQLESEGHFRRQPIQGRLKTAMINGEKTTLAVHDSDGEPLNNVPDVDFLINAIGKSKKTPLINALKEKGCIQDNDVAQGGPSIRPGHPMLSGDSTIFQPELGEDIVDSAGMWWNPEITTPKTEPDGWEKAFKVACKLLGKCA